MKLFFSFYILYMCETMLVRITEFSKRYHELTLKFFFIHAYKLVTNFLSNNLIIKSFKDEKKPMKE